MLRGIVFTLILCLQPSAALTQLVREHDGQGLRSFHGQTSRIRRSFQSDAEARAVFKYILAVSGLAGMEDRIVIRASAETDNTEAMVERTADKEERLIFYNVLFMEDIAKKTKNYWSMVAILAHEVGHHIRLHTVIPGRDHEFELEADYQAGFILRRMGATLEQTQAAFRGIGTDVATPSHPARAQRYRQPHLDGRMVRARWDHCPLSYRWASRHTSGRASTKEVLRSWTLSRSSTRALLKRTRLVRAFKN